jgi:hypothetical protein
MNPFLRLTERDDVYPGMNAGTITIVGGVAETSNNALTFSAGTGVLSVNVAVNFGVAPSSYTLSAVVNMYQKIFSDQCARVSSFIYDNLEQLDRSDDDYNEKIIERIAEAIDLVGEPASYTATIDANILREDHFVFSRLLLAIASSRHRETEAYRLEVLRGYAQNEDVRTRHAAIRALGRMRSDAAKNALREISKQAGQKREVAQFAAAFAR